MGKPSGDADTVTKELPPGARMKMDEKSKELCRRLKELTNLDNGRRDLPGILSSVAAMTRDLIEAPLAYAAMNNDRADLVAVADDAYSEAHADPWKGPGNLGERVFRTKESVVWSAGEEPEPSELDFLERFQGQSWIGTTIPMQDRSPGILAVARESGRPFSQGDQDMVEIIAAHSANAINNILAFREVESLSVTDDLTHIYNYRFLKAALQREVERSSRYAHVFSILMIDVDHLKQFNDVHGHLKGSDLLRRLAQILLNRSRAIDLVAKYGGDEFLIILPQTSTQGAEVMGNRICRAVAEVSFPLCEPGDITISTGVSSFPQHGANMEALLAAADAALFEAKRGGRNRVVAAHGPALPGHGSKVV